MSMHGEVIVQIIKYGVNTNLCTFTKKYYILKERPYKEHATVELVEKAHHSWSVGSNKCSGLKKKQRIFGKFLNARQKELE